MLRNSDSYVKEKQEKREQRNRRTVEKSEPRTPLEKPAHIPLGGKHVIPGPPATSIVYRYYSKETHTEKIVVRSGDGSYLKEVRPGQPTERLVDLQYTPQPREIDDSDLLMHGILEGVVYFD
eukprot:GHVU01214109.1.p1 GENE.GHVU01214109.1~~GHVU01214109.1.p1  ORF type:complete len:122 (+),score=17.26 GHVU01214109.1:51-416(+)